MATLKGHSRHVRSVAVSPNGMLASGSGDRKIKCVFVVTTLLCLMSMSHVCLRHWYRVKAKQ